MTKPTPIPRKLNPINSWLNPWRPKMMGNAWKDMYRMPRIKAVLERSFDESPGDPVLEVTLPDIQEQDHPVVQQHLYPIVRRGARAQVRHIVITHGKVGGS